MRAILTFPLVMTKTRRSNASVELTLAMTAAFWAILARSDAWARSMFDWIIRAMACRVP